MSEVLTAREGSVLTITLNRPDVFNALNRALHGALRAALEDAADPDIRAVVITGAGRAQRTGAPARRGAVSGLADAVGVTAAVGAVGRAAGLGAAATGGCECDDEAERETQCQPAKVDFHGATA